MAISIKQLRRRLEVTDYEFTNETINRLMDDGDKVMIVQGSYGRVPILANDAEEAKDRYLEKFHKQVTEELNEEDESQEE